MAVKTPYIVANTYKGKFAIPMIDIAEHRANYYAQEDGFSKDSDDYRGEIAFIVTDSYEAIQWLVNESNFEDWQGIAIKIAESDGSASKDDFWNDSDFFEVQELDLSGIVQKDANGWVKCSDSLPKNSEYVLGFDGYSTVVYYFNANDNTFFDGIHYYDAKNLIVTHWQPLPKPPIQ